MSAKGLSIRFDDSCSCRDCQSYQSHIKNESFAIYVICEDLSPGRCKNYLFHQTSIESNIQRIAFPNPFPKDYNSTLSLNCPSLPKSVFENVSQFQRTEHLSSNDLSYTGNQSEQKNDLSSIGNHSVSTGHLPNNCYDIDNFKDRPSISHSAPQLSSNIPRCICKDSPIVYVTFASGSKRHEDEIRDLCELCDRAGFTVKCDSDRALMENGELNVNQWRDINFQRAALVLFCISPAYNGMVYLLEEDNIATAEENDHLKGALYIFNLARAELVDSYSIDKRFFCVLFTNAGGKLGVPRCFTPYSKFKFPGESEILISAMQHRYKRNQRRQ